jgi:RNA polymerase sigma-70 factor (ECF subfamily)
VSEEIKKININYNFVTKSYISATNQQNNTLNTFEEIYDRNYRRMFCVAQKMVGDRDNASDIVQEVFIYLFSVLNNGIVIIHVNTWLYRATINKSIDFLRKQKRFQNLESVKNYITDDEIIEKQETTAAINSAISKLKEKEKVLIVLYSQGLTYKEITEVTGIRFSSIGKMLSRTLEKLEIELKNQHYEMY